ncbi:MAG: hypothetical protein Q7S11_04520 [bacterium]|nr:hypothetical protein [bacterium]
MVLVASKTFAEGVENTTVASVDSSQASTNDSLLPDVSGPDNYMGIMTACLFAPDGTGATATTERGISGLSWFTYSRLDWDRRSLPHERGETHSDICLGKVNVLVYLFLDTDNKIKIFDADTQHFLGKQVMGDDSMFDAWTYSDSMYVFRSERNK